MTAALLIAGNFIREQRWLIVLLLAWAVFAAVLFGTASENPYNVGEALFYLRQQAAYAVLFAVFVTAPALLNERKSRRVLAVLSKGVTRAEYLSGLLLGALGAVAVYILAFLGLAWWLFEMRGLGAAEAGGLALVALSGCLFAAALAQLFSTFMHSMVALGFTWVTLALPAPAAAVGVDIAWLVPTYRLAMNYLAFGATETWQPDWMAAGLAVGGSGLLVMLAAAIFARRDVTVAAE